MVSFLSRFTTRVNIYLFLAVYSFIPFKSDYVHINDTRLLCRVNCSFVLRFLSFLFFGFSLINILLPLNDVIFIKERKKVIYI